MCTKRCGGLVGSATTTCLGAMSCRSCSRNSRDGRAVETLEKVSNRVLRHHGVNRPLRCAPTTSTACHSHSSRCRGLVVGRRRAGSATRPPPRTPRGGRCRPRMGKAKKVPCKMMVHIWGSIRWQGRRRWLRLTDVPMSLVTSALAEPSRSCCFKGGRKKRTKRRLPLPAPRLHAGAQTCHWECSKRNQKILIRYLEEMTVASLHLAGSLILVWHNRDSCKQRNGTSYESPLTSKNSITMKYYSKNANTPHHVGDDVPPCFSRQAR